MYIDGAVNKHVREKRQFSSYFIDTYSVLNSSRERWVCRHSSLALQKSVS